VIVDEVQDLNRIGVQLMHALVGDRPDGLLLVGDGQQAVYPGGFTLNEAGINVKGRSVALSRNYRNSSLVLRRALDHIGEDTFTDLEADEESGAGSVDVERQGGQVLDEKFAGFADQCRRVVELIRWTTAHGTSTGDLAVLVPSNRDARAWEATLRGAGIAVCLLQDYDGRPTEAIKVGTYQRAKGLEFSSVFLPDFDRTGRFGSDRGADGPDEAALLRRQQFVAMTRARDRLWIGRSTPRR
jgi:superfamily I DNA/RNA helicase